MQNFSIIVGCLVLGLVALAEPKSMGERSGGTARKLVLLCYSSGSHVSRLCRHVRQRIGSDCKPPIELVEITDKAGRTLTNPTATQVKESLARDNLPRHTPVMVLGHAVLDYQVDPKDKEKVIPLHRLSSGPKKSENTEEVLDQIRAEMDEPSIWLMACNAGLACNKGCIGGACAADQTVEFAEGFGLPLPGGGTRKTMSNPQTNHMLDLLCSKEKFDRADSGDPSVKGDAREGDGVLDSAELQASLCTLPESRRYFDFFLDTHEHGEGEIVEISKERREAQKKEFLKQIRATLTEEMGREMTSQWASWRKQRAWMEREMAGQSKVAAKIAAYRKTLQEIDEKLKTKPKDAALIQKYNSTVEDLNETVDDFNRRQSNMGISGENRALYSLWQLTQDQYGSVDEVMRGLVREESPEIDSGSLTLRNRRTGRMITKPKDQRVRYYLPEPKKQNTCIWTGSDAFATPQLAKFELHFSPSKARPKAKRPDPSRTGESRPLGPDPKKSH